MKKRETILFIFIVLTSLIVTLTLTSCIFYSKENRAKQLIGDKVVVLSDIIGYDYSKPWDGTFRPSIEGSNTTIFHKFNTGNKQIIPFFLSEDAYHAAFNPRHGGAMPDLQIVNIDRTLFIQMVDPQEICVLNVGLSSEMTFTGAELAQIFLYPSDTPNQHFIVFIPKLLIVYPI